ncbi:MAG: response regulator [Candidatus Uhrbacteria bacterium]
MPNTKKHILIVEDEIFVSELYQEQLEKAGFNTTVAGNGKEALNCLNEHVPDLILLDLVMPGMNGFELLEMLQKDDDWKKIKVVVLSNLSQDTDKIKCKEFGVCHFMIKTKVSVEDVITEVKRRCN